MGGFVSVGFLRIIGSAAPRVRTQVGRCPFRGKEIPTHGKAALFRGGKPVVMKQIRAVPTLAGVCSRESACVVSPISLE